MAKAKKRIAARKKPKRGEATPKPARNKRTTVKKTMPKVRRTKTKGLFYKERPDSDSLVFAPPKVAEYVSAIHHALEATTWGKFKALMPPKEYRRLLKNVQAGDLDRDNGAREQTKLPSDDAPFDPAVWFPEWCVGDYPDWLQAAAKINT
jgi:hypothetical protein